MRYSEETKQNVVNAIVNGELWLEEAMVKFEVQNRMTIIKWLKEYLIKKNNAICRPKKIRFCSPMVYRIDYNIP